VRVGSRRLSIINPASERCCIGVSLQGLSKDWSEGIEEEWTGGEVVFFLKRDMFVYLLVVRACWESRGGGDSSSVGEFLGGGRRGG